MSKEELQHLREKLENHDRRITELENVLKVEKEVPIIRAGVGIKKLSEKLNIPAKIIDGIYDIEDDLLTLVNHVGADRKEKTQNTVLLTLIGYKLYFGQEEVLSQELRRNVAENRISLNHFGAYLNELIPRLLRRKGKLRSPKTSYRLTIQGEVNARDLIREIADSSRA